MGDTEEENIFNQLIHNDPDNDLTEEERQLDIDVDGFLINLQRTLDNLNQQRLRLENDIETEKNRLIREKKI